MGASRRGLLLASGGLLSLTLSRRAYATPEMLKEALHEFAGEAEIEEGAITLDVPPLVENGNVVPLTVTVESPMTETDHVVEIALFNERNPQPHVARFQLGPRSGRATVGMRMRLATSQRVTAVARLSDGRFIGTGAEVIVTLAACIES